MSATPIRPSGSNLPQPDRLDSWKEVAAYLKRGARTVQRWEREEGLPVHRLVHEKRGTVYAFKSELDTWWNSRRATLEKESEPEEPAAGNSSPHSLGLGIAGPDTITTGKRNSPLTLVAAVVLGLVALGGAAFWIWSGREEQSLPATTAFPLTSYPGYELQPSFSPDGTQVAFTWNRDKGNNFDIFVKLVGASEALQVTDNPARDYSPAWSPDGQFIAFVRARPQERLDVLLIPALGGPERKLAETHRPFFSPDLDALAGSGLLAWTRDSKCLVLSDRRSLQSPSALTLICLTGERRPLTFPPDQTAGDYSPALSPDNRRLAFVRTTGLMAGDLFVLELSSDLKPAGEPGALTSDHNWNESPVWTHNGREIVFSSSRNGGVRLRRTGLSPARRDGAGNEGPISVGENGHFPAISRSGSRMAYSRSMKDANIWRVATAEAGRPIERPTVWIHSTALEGNPDYSPDGRKIVFGSTRSGGWEIWIADADGMHPRQVTTFGGPMTGTPRWSPDGKHIAFDSNVGGKVGVYLVNSEGGAARLLTTSPTGDSMPSWSRDARWVYFTSNRSGSQQIWKIPSEGGAAIQVTYGGGVYGIESRDGKSLYLLKSNGPAPLWQMPLDGGQERKILESVFWRNFAVGTHGLYFMRRESGGYSIHFYSFATRKISAVASGDRPAHLGLTISPDTRWLLYTQIDHQGSDLVVVENFR